MPSHIQLHRTLLLYVLSRIKRYAESHYTAPLGLNGSHYTATLLLYVLSRIKRYAESHYTAPPYVAALCII